MDQANHQLETFGTLLRQYPQSSRFYNSCPPNNARPSWSSCPN